MSTTRIFGLTALAAAAALAYSPRSSAQSIGSFAAGEEEETAPRYQIEVIVFANTDFDPNEELLDVAHLAHPPVPAGPPPQRKYLDALMRLAMLKQVEAPVIAPAGAPGDRQVFPANLLALEMFPGGNASGLDFRLLEPDEYQLNTAYARINRLSAYKALAHGGWVQEAVDEENAVPFDIANLAALGVRGTIRLHVSRFLHVTVDLTYRPVGQLPALLPAGIAGSFEPAFGVLSEIDIGPSYELHAERRILRGELNYLDHPAFGVVLLITLEPKPEMPAAETRDASGPSA